MAGRARFCSHCGSEASGNFCHSCGSMLHGVAVDEEVILMAEVVETDWTSETDFARLMQHPEVRWLVAQAASRCSTQLSGEEWLSLFDAVSPTGVPLEKLCRVIAPLYAKMGIRTGKSMQVQLSLPPGRVIVAVLCSLASQGIQIKDAQQATNGCVLIGTIPSNIWSFAGELIVGIHYEAPQTMIEAAAQIPGQLYDWGKSQRILDHLLQDAQAFAA